MPKNQAPAPSRGSFEHPKRHHPRAQRDAEILCAIDCGMPNPDCRCLRAMLTDRGLTAAAPATAPKDEPSACTAPDCTARRAQGGAQALVPVTDARTASGLWRAVLRALTGGAVT